MRFLAAAPVALLPFLAACGYIGGVQPPLANIPNTVADLAALQRGARIIAHFTIPATTTETMPIKGKLDLELRAGVPPDPWNETQWARQSQRFAPVRITGALAEYEIPAAAWVGKDVVVAVRTTGDNGKPSNWSKPLALPVMATLEPPADFAPTPLPTGIRLTWRSGAGHFRVLRMEQGEPAFKLMATTEGPECLDASATLGKTYTYQALSFTPIDAGGEAQSELSTPVTIAYKDVFPPAPPTGVRALPSPNSIELSWEPNTEPDLAGYRVYRSVNGAAFERLADTSVPAYSDRAVEAGKSYRYAVTASDQTKNESSRSVEVTVEFGK